MYGLQIPRKLVAADFTLGCTCLLSLQLLPPSVVVLPSVTHLPSSISILLPHPCTPSAVKMFSNELYTEGDVLGGPNNGRSLQPSMTGGHIDHNNYGNNNNTYGSNTSNNYNSNTNLNGSMSPTAPYGAQKIAQQRSTLASRRKERMEANILSPNASGETGQPSPRTERGGFGRSPSMRAAGTNLNNTNRGSDNGDSNRGDNSNGGYINSNGGYINTNNGDGDQHDQKSVLNGLAPSYDPTPKPEEPFVARPYVRPMGPPGPVPPAPIADELVISTFLNTPGPKMGPILCYILRDKGNAKMYPKVSETGRGETSMTSEKN